MEPVLCAIFLLTFVFRIASALPLFPSSDDSVTSHPSIDNSTVYVTLSFFSTPSWPNNGETESIVVLPLGEWRTPEEIESLPLHPLKVRIMGAQHSAGPNGIKAAYSDLNSIACEAAVAGEYRSLDTEKQTPLVATDPVLFRFEDEQVTFRSRDESKPPGHLKLLRFGCW